MVAIHCGKWVDIRERNCGRKINKFSWLDENGVEESVGPHVGLECFIPGFQEEIGNTHSPTHTHIYLQV